MEINELRIGNIIHVSRLPDDFDIKTGKNVIDKKLMLDILMYKSVQENIKPISISGKILIDLGFSNYCNYSISEGFPWGVSLIIDIKNKRTLISSERGSSEIKNIEYIHEIQNIYSSLTGKELFFKSRIPLN